MAEDLDDLQAIADGTPSPEVSFLQVILGEEPLLDDCPRRSKPAATRTRSATNSDKPAASVTSKVEPAASVPFSDQSEAKSQFLAGLAGFSRILRR